MISWAFFFCTFRVLHQVLQVQKAKISQSNQPLALARVGRAGRVMLFRYVYPTEDPCFSFLTLPALALRAGLAFVGCSCAYCGAPVRAMVFGFRTRGRAWCRVPWDSDFRCATGRYVDKLQLRDDPKDHALQRVEAPALCVLGRTPQKATSRGAHFPLSGQNCGNRLSPFRVQHLRQDS